MPRSAMIAVRSLETNTRSSWMPLPSSKLDPNRRGYNLTQLVPIDMVPDDEQQSGHTDLVAPSRRRRHVELPVDNFISIAVVGRIPNVAREEPDVCAQLVACLPPPVSFHRRGPPAQKISRPALLAASSSGVGYMPRAITTAKSRVTTAVISAGT